MSINGHKYLELARKFNETKLDQGRIDEVYKRIRYLRLKIEEANTMKNGTKVEGVPFYIALWNNFTTIVETCGTAYVNAKLRTIGIDPDFILGLTPEARKNKIDMYDFMRDEGFMDDESHQQAIESLDKMYQEKSIDDLFIIIMHELHHPMQESYERKSTLMRYEKFDMDIWGKAVDYPVNNSIAMSLYGSIPKFLEKHRSLDMLCISEDFLDLTIEQCYMKLVNEGDGGGGGNQMDLHFDEELTPDEQQTLQSMISSSAKAAGQQGCPNGVYEKYGDTGNVQVKWQNAFKKRVISHRVVDSNYRTYNPFARYLTNYCHSNGFLSKKNQLMLSVDEVNEEIETLSAIDVSGSISADEKRAYLGEMLGIIKVYKDFKMHVVSWDTESGINPQTYTRKNMRDVKNYEIRNGGGTMVGDFIRDCSENPLYKKVKEVVIFTDGYIGDLHQISNPVGKNIMWVIVGNKSFQAPFGKVYHITPVKQK